MRALSDGLPARAWRRVPCATAPIRRPKRTSPRSATRQRPIGVIDASPQKSGCCASGVSDPRDVAGITLYRWPPPPRSRVSCSWPIPLGDRTALPGFQDRTRAGHFEGRSYPGWQRHMVIGAIASAFLQTERRRRRTGSALSFPQARAFVQEIFTGLLFISRPPHYMRWMKEAERRFHQLRLRQSRTSTARRRGAGSRATTSLGASGCLVRDCGRAQMLCAHRQSVAFAANWLACRFASCGSLRTSLHCGALE